MSEAGRVAEQGGMSGLRPSLQKWAKDGAPGMVLA